MKKRYGFGLLSVFVSIAVYAKITGYDITSTPTLPNSKDHIYDITALTDKNLQTAWCVSGDNAIGATITIKSPNPNISGFGILNGYIKTDKAFNDNSRISNATAYVDGVKTKNIVFGSNFDKGWINFPDKPGYEVKFVVDKVYQGKKYQDLCVTELILDKELLEGFLQLDKITRQYIGKAATPTAVATDYATVVDGYFKNPELYERITELYATWNNERSITAFVNLYVAAESDLGEFSDVVTIRVAQLIKEQVIANPEYARAFYAQNEDRAFREIIESIYDDIALNRANELEKISNKTAYAELGQEIQDQNNIQVAPPACTCPRGAGSSEGDAPFLIHDFGNIKLMACGYVDDRTGLASEFEIRECPSGEKYAEYWALDNRKVYVENGVLYISDIRNLPFGPNWEWIPVEFSRETYSPDGKGGFIYKKEKTFKFPILNQQQIDKINKRYEDEKDDTDRNEEIVYLMMLLALNGDPVGTERFLTMKQDFHLDGGMAESYNDAFDIYNENKPN